MVASQRTHVHSNDAHSVSIPFIAGQWSLLMGRLTSPINAPTFQSPSLRGSGRFNCKRAQQQVRPGRPFQSPSLRGSGRFTIFPPNITSTTNMFQSPSLRGSGRFTPTVPLSVLVLALFQSPSLRGSGRFVPLSVLVLALLFLFQSPSLRGSGRFPYSIL